MSESHEFFANNLQSVEHVQSDDIQNRKVSLSLRCCENSRKNPPTQFLSKLQRNASITQTVRTNVSDNKKRVSLRSPLASCLKYQLSNEMQACNTGEKATAQTLISFNRQVPGHSRCSESGSESARTIPRPVSEQGTSSRPQRHSASLHDDEQKNDRKRNSEIYHFHSHSSIESKRSQGSKIPPVGGSEAGCSTPEQVTGTEKSDPLANQHLTPTDVSMYKTSKNFQEKKVRFGPFFISKSSIPLSPVVPVQKIDDSLFEDISSPGSQSPERPKLPNSFATRYHGWKSETCLNSLIFHKPPQTFFEHLLNVKRNQDLKGSLESVPASHLPHGSKISHYYESNKCAPRKASPILTQTNFDHKKGICFGEKLNQIGALLKQCWSSTEGKYD